MKKNIGILSVVLFLVVLVIMVTMFLNKKNDKIENNNTDNTTRMENEQETTTLNDATTSEVSTYEDVISTESSVEPPNSSMSEDEIFYAYMEKGVEDIKNNGVVYSQGETVSYGFMEYKLDEMIILYDLYDYQSNIPNFDETTSYCIASNSEYQNDFDDYIQGRENDNKMRTAFIYVSMDITNASELKREKYIVPEICVSENFSLKGYGSYIVYMKGTLDQEEVSVVNFEPWETRHIEAVMEVHYELEENDDINNLDFYVLYQNGVTPELKEPINETLDNILIQGEPEFRY